MAHHNIWLFLLYGPASRLIMAVLLFVGQLSYNRHSDGEAYRTNRHIWLAWLALFLAIDTGVAWIAYSPTAGSPWVRVSMEGGALAFSAINVIALLTRRIRSPLMTIYGISVTAFALSSLAFILGRPWNHMWWLAHAIFAAGFFLLSYGVVKAFQTTRSFSTIYSQEELMTRLGEAKARTEDALRELQAAHQQAGASGGHRSAHRPGEPARVHRTGGGRDCQCKPCRRAVFRAGARPGPLQGHQRYLWPPGRRSRPAALCQEVPRGDPPPRRRRPRRRRRIHGAAAENPPQRSHSTVA